MIYLLLLVVITKANKVSKSVILISVYI